MARLKPGVKPLGTDSKVNFVLSAHMLKRYRAKCKRLGLSSSHVGRLLVEYFVANDLDIPPPKVVKK